MIIVNRIYGHCDDPFWSGICEELDARGCLEILAVSKARRSGSRERATTNKGTVVGITLNASDNLRPGSVLFYEENRRVVLAELRDARVLVIATLNNFSEHDALQLGHYLGQLGWSMKVRHHATHLEIFVPCGLFMSDGASGNAVDEEAAMDAALRDCPIQNIAWTFRDRRASDP